MKLSKIARAINQLCLDLGTAPQGGEAPTPWGGFPPVIGWAEVHPEKVRLLEEASELVDEFSGVRLYGGASGGPSFKLRGWWAQIGGMPPVHCPHSITLEDLQRDAQGLFNVRRLSCEEAWRYFNLNDPDAHTVLFEEAREIPVDAWARLHPKP